MIYLLDTCVVSDFVKGDTQTLLKMKQESPSDIAISTISLHEIRYGLALHPKKAEKIGGVIQDFISAIHILDFSQGCAAAAARIRARLKLKGEPIGSYDILIAGSALHYQLTLVTSNIKEFSRIEDIQCENWR